MGVKTNTLYMTAQPEPPALAPRYSTVVLVRINSHVPPDRQKLGTMTLDVLNDVFEEYNPEQPERDYRAVSINVDPIEKLDDTADIPF